MNTLSKCESQIKISMSDKSEAANSINDEEEKLDQEKAEKNKLLLQSE